MNYLHYEADAGPNDFIEISLDKRANVRVMDPLNYQNYEEGKKHRYHGGLAKKSPVYVKPPHQGCWNVVVDLGGYAGTVRVSVRVLRGKVK